MGLEHLIIGRHCEYGNGADPGLNENGRQQAEALAQAIGVVLHDTERTILTSTSRRAKETADIIGRMLGTVVQDAPEFWDDNRHHSDLGKCVALIGERTESAVIVVTHKVLAPSLAQAIHDTGMGERDWRQSQVSFGELRYGQAWHIDFRKKAHQLLGG